MPYWHIAERVSVTLKLQPWSRGAKSTVSNNAQWDFACIRQLYFLLEATAAHSGFNKLVVVYRHSEFSEFFVPIYVIVRKRVGTGEEKIKDRGRRWSCREKRNDCKDSCKCRMPTLSFAFLPVLSKPLTQCSLSPPLSVCLPLSAPLSPAVASIR